MLPVLGTEEEHHYHHHQKVVMGMSSIPTSIHLEKIKSELCTLSTKTVILLPSPFPDYIIKPKESQ